MRLLARGMSVSRIAAELIISHKTVSTHKARLMEKMGFISTADIVRYAMEQQML
ncbi:Transcriptional regulatory protein UhpA [compost metagenome]